MIKIPNRIGSIEVYQDGNEIAEQAALGFVKRANASKSAGRFSVALSGGSTPKTLYSLLASDRFRDQVPWDIVHLFWGDERCVPPDHPDSNYRMTNEAMLSKVPIPAANVHRIEAERDPDEAAALYASVLEKELGPLPQFDLIWLGMGDDGHTASLFPHTTAIHDTDHLVSTPYVEKFKTHRITLTAKVINNAARIEFLITGSSKTPVLHEVLEGPLDQDRLPSQLVQPTNGELLFMLDKAAAGQLSFLQ